MQAVEVLGRKSSVFIGDQSKIIHAPFDRILVSNCDFAPHGREDKPDMVDGKADIVDQEYISSYSFMKYATFCGEIIVIIFMIARNPICSIKMISDVAEEIEVFFYTSKGYDISGQ